MFPSKAAEIRFLASEGYTPKEIASKVGCSAKHVYACRSREISARTINGQLKQLFRDVGSMRRYSFSCQERYSEQHG